MSEILLEYMITKKEGRSWRREYERRVTENLDGDKTAYLARLYASLVDDLLDELPASEIGRIIARLAERMTNPDEVAP